jgi:hypothetical protein
MAGECVSTFRRLDTRGGTSVSRKGLLAAALAAVVLLGLVGSAYSQERYLRLEGHVQWIAGQTMILATNTDGMDLDSYVPQALWSVRVDLTEVPQDEYDSLTQGDFVIVTGVLVDNSWLAGASIERALGS